MFAAPSAVNPLQKPVSVYALDYSQAESTAFTCYPTPLLGTNYCVLAYPADGGYSSQFAIVVTASNTTVWITPSPNANLIDPHSGTNTYTVMDQLLQTNLQPGATYQINGDAYLADVTGTMIKSDKPIAVFAGAAAAYVPYNNFDALNPLLQEQLPVDSWGTNVLALSFAGRTTGGDLYRVLAAFSNTVVTITTTNGTIVTTNQAGQFYETNSLGGPVEFQGSQPIQVAQFANGWGFNTPPDENGDPCEILLPPTGRWLKTNIVVTLPDDGVTGAFPENYLNLIVPQSATNSTLVDGASVPGTSFVAIDGSGYYGAQITVTNSGVHTVTSSQPVGVEVYGFGIHDAYGYFGGMVK